MEQTLLSRQDLAKRWGFNSSKVIENYELSGIIKRVPNLPTPRYLIYDIEKLETAGQNLNPFCPTERRRLENKIKALEKELASYKDKIANIKMLIV